VKVGDRLRDAIKWRGWSIRRFQRELERVCKKREIRGCSYPTIHRYLKNENEPSVEFLRSAARLLQVREEWLITGIGERTTPEEIVTYQPTVSVTLLEHATRKLRMAGPVVEPVLLELLRRLLASCPDVSESDPGYVARLGGSIQELVLEPLRRFDPHFAKGKDRTGEQHVDYLLAMLHALMFAVPGRREGQPFEKLQAALRGLDSP